MWSAKSKAQNGENARFSDPLCLGREEDRPQRSECARTHSLAWAVTGNPEGPFGGASAGWGGPQGPLHHPHFSTPLSSAEQPVLLCLASLPHSWLGRRHLWPRGPRRRAPAWLAHASHCRPATWTEGIRGSLPAPRPVLKPAAAHRPSTAASSRPLVPPRQVLTRRPVLPQHGALLHLVTLCNT